MPSQRAQIFPPIPNVSGQITNEGILPTTEARLFWADSMLPAVAARYLPTLPPGEEWVIFTGNPGVGIVHMDPEWMLATRQNDGRITVRRHPGGYQTHYTGTARFYPTPSPSEERRAYEHYWSRRTRQITGPQAQVTLRAHDWTHKMMPGDELWVYDDIGTLAGSAGEMLVRPSEQRLIALKALVVS